MYKDLLKAIMMQPEVGVDLNTAEQSMDVMSNKKSKWKQIFENELSALEVNAPHTMSLDEPYMLEVTKEDDGVYSGYVTIQDLESGEMGEVQGRFVKMTIDAMITALKTRGYITEDTPPEPEKGSLKDLLSNLKGFKGDIHIHLAKADPKELLELLQKARGKVDPVGTQREWSDGHRYVKHADGWIRLGGPHHGKLMGKFKGEATHKDYADANNSVTQSVLTSLEAGIKGDEESKKKQEEAVQFADKKTPTITFEEATTRAKEFGKKAFENGLKYRTLGDPDFLAFLKEHVFDREFSERSSSAKIMAAWQEAWHKANLAAPIPEIPKEEPKVIEAIDKKEEKAAKVEDELKEVGIDVPKPKTKPIPVFKITQLDSGRIAVDMDGQQALITSDMAHAERFVKTETEKTSLYANAHNLTQKEFVEQYTKLIESRFNMDSASGRASYKLSGSNLKNTKAMHSTLVTKAHQEGYEIPDKVLKDFPLLSGLPEELDDENQKKTNLFKAVNLKKLPKKRVAEVHKMLRECNAVFAEMGLKLKVPLNFTAGTALKEGDLRSTRAQYTGGGSLERGVVLLDVSQAETSIMHEIGHAIDYAMSTGKSGDTRSKDMGRLNDKVDRDVSDLEKAYRDVLKLVEDSDYYEYYKKNDPKWHRSYLMTPTEVFARAFEVYSLGKAQKLVSEGKISKDFVDSYKPCVFNDLTSKSTESSKIKAERDVHVKKIQELNSAMDAQYKSILQEKFGGKDESYEERKAVLDFQRETPEYKANMEALTEAGKQKEVLTNKWNESLKKEAIIPEDKQKEYIAQVSKIMDFILKNDSIKKALELSNLLEVLTKSEDDDLSDEELDIISKALNTLSKGGVGSGIDGHITFHPKKFIGTNANKLATTLKRYLQDQEGVSDRDISKFFEYNVHTDEFTMHEAGHEALVRLIAHRKSTDRDRRALQQKFDANQKLLNKATALELLQTLRDVQTSNG